MSTDHADHGHDADGAHAPPDADAAPPTAPPAEPAPPPLNPFTRGPELRVLQTAFHLATHSLFVYFSEPGSILAFSPEDKRLEVTFLEDVKADGRTADRLAELVRERGTEPQAQAFPEKFTRLNYVTFSSAAQHFREDLATHVEALARIQAFLPLDATPTVRETIEQFRDVRAKQLAFWAEEEKKAAAALAARLAAKKAPPKPAGKH